MIEDIKKNLFFQSIFDNDIIAIKEMLEEDFDVNVIDSKGIPALNYAVYGENYDIVKLMLMKGADPNSKDDDGLFALYIAVCMKNNISLTKLLLENGACPDVIFNNETPLIASVNQEDLKMLSILLEYNADPNIIINDNSALINAIRKNISGIVQLLLKNGADPNICTNDNTTVLLTAVINNNLDIVKILLDNKANANICNKNGWSPLIIAVDENNVSLVKLLIENGANVDIDAFSSITPLLKSVYNENYEISKILIENGANVNFKEPNYGKTPLRIALEKDNIKIVDLLLKNNTDLNIQDDKYGHTALMYAIDHKNDHISEILIEYGADLNIQTKNNWTALMMAIVKKNDHISEILIEHGADLNIQKTDGYTALMTAIDHKNDHLSEILIEHGADLNIQDNYGYTALMMAIVKKNDHISEILIEHGADLNIQDNFGYTALMNAIVNKNDHLSEILIEHGADLNIQAHDGYTALMTAIDHRNDHISEILIEHGADLNIQDNNGDVALNLAIIRQNIHIITNILQHNPIIEFKNNKNESINDIINKTNNQDIMKIYSKYTSQQTGVTTKKIDIKNNLLSDKRSAFNILSSMYNNVYSRDVFITPNIPSKKINGAIKSISKNTIDPNDILCLYDSTLFGSATDGTIFTKDKFYYKSLGSDPLNFYYKDINSVEYMQNESIDKKGNKKTEEYVEINYTADGNQLILKYSDCSSCKDFVSMLLELSKSNIEDKEITRQPLEEMPSYIRITYLKIVINFLLSDDSQIDEKEFSQLYSLISRLKMNSEDRLTLAEYKQKPEDTDSLTQKIVSNVDDVSKQEILFSLCKDFIYIQIETKNIPYTKSKFIMDFARKNSISIEQLELFKNSIENDKKIFDDNIDDTGLETGFKSIASNAAAVGVPLAALYFSGSVVGLGAAGITSGLATLGLGGMLGFSSMVTGVGAVILIGIGAKKGVEHLTGQGEIDKRKKKEAMLLEVNKCLQKSINMLMEDLNSFTMRLTELISTHSNLSEALDQREEQIQKLVSQLKLLMGSSKYLSSDRDQAYLAAVKQKLPRHLDLERLAAITEEPTVKKYYAVITSFYSDNGNGALKEDIDVDSAEQLAKILDSLGYFSVSSITKQGINKLKGLFN